MDTLARERQEAEIALASRDPADVISAVVGANHYSARHRFDDLRSRMQRQVEFTASALTVSRFYFTASPPVVVDVVDRPERYAREIATKRAYCELKGFRYVLVTDDYDDDGVREQLRPRTVPVPAPAAVPKRPARAGQIAKPARSRKAASS